MADMSTKTGTLGTSTLPNRRDAGDELRNRLGVGRSSIDKPSRRAKTIETIKTLLWVIPLTMLVWLYAAREEMREDEVPRIPIKLRATAADRIVTLANPKEDRITLELEGPQAGLSKVKDALSNSQAVLEVELPDDWQLPYSGPVSLAERIGKLDLFAREAVTVKRTKPATVEVRAEKKATATAKVQMRPADRLIFTGEVNFEPATVELEVPESMAGPTTRSTELEVYADLSKVLSKPAGRYVEQVPVLLKDGERQDVLLRMKTVTATVDIKRTKELQLASVPVNLEINAGQLVKNTFVFAPDKVTVPSVTITGPAYAVDALDQRVNRDKTFVVAVVIEIKPEDLTSIVGGETKTIPIQLGPDNFKLPKDLAKDLVATTPVREIVVQITPQNY